MVGTIAEFRLVPAMNRGRSRSIGSDPSLRSRAASDSRHDDCGLMEGEGPMRECFFLLPFDGCGAAMRRMPPRPKPSR
jgi:hypothetical protein